MKKESAIVDEQGKHNWQQHVMCAETGVQHVWLMYKQGK